MSSMQTQQPGSLPDIHLDPYRLIEDDLKYVYDDIRRELIANTSVKELQEIATYYFDGQGKALRPMAAILMARAINYHKERNDLLPTQRQVALIAEMIHGASLIHDDVIDQSDYRRGKASVNVKWSQKKSQPRYKKCAQTIEGSKRLQLPVDLKGWTPRRSRKLACPSKLEEL
ncbi:hypothetical protein KQX54_006020 [Cotesia glomerata]|uniref:Uncharacterized protein n=1 Tax=Cotesia glomerata TaxID=32391 RepID=A0AAV7IXX9_COTGL|nr:hypothetical protein KQX54_006020 [Cotesia glomerata]